MKKSTVRTIYEIAIEENDGILSIRYHGDGFLYNMVRIITGTLQGIVNAVDYGMTPERLVNLPYIHVITNAQGLEVEYGISEDTLKLLEARGHHLVRNTVDQAMSTMLNSVMRVDGDYYAAGTGRVDGCGGALLPDGSAVLEGVSQEI